MASVRRILVVLKAPNCDHMDLCARMNIHDRPNGIKWGDWVRLTFVDTGKSVVCRVKGDDDPFGPVQLRDIHINSHLRDMLGLKSDMLAAYRPEEFRMEKAASWAFFWYIFRYHPDDTKRQQVLFGMITVSVTIGLGLAGLLLRLLLQ